MVRERLLAAEHGRPGLPDVVWKPAGNESLSGQGEL
jgi:hypothetical protein